MSTGSGIKIVFMGTPEFAVDSLKTLVEGGYQVVSVVTVPDKPAGRGQKLQESAVKKYAMDKGIPVLQPEKLKDPGFITQLHKLNADLFVVVAFRMLPEIVWSMPRLGTFNLHAALLPQYRGAAPLNWAVINGEKETGVTTFLLDHQIDTGKILFQERISIGENDTVGNVHDDLMKIGSTLVLKTVDALATGNYKAIDQSNIAVTDLKHAPKISKEDCHIDWQKSGNDIRNMIRGLSPYPAAWTELIIDGTPVAIKIFKAVFKAETGVTPGTISIDESHFKISTADGWLTILELQLSGKKRMTTEELLRGFRFSTITF